MNNTNQNHVFGRLWEQAVSNQFNREVDRAKNSEGRRAIKLKTEGMHRALIVETDMRPGFEVHLCGFPEKCGLVNSAGVVSFTTALETISLTLLIRQIDRWTHSYETIFGPISEGRSGTGTTIESTSTADVVGGRQDQQLPVTSAVPVF